MANKKNTQYLKWDIPNKQLQVSGNNFIVIVDEETQFRGRSGYQGWKLYKENCYLVELPAKITRQLFNHVKFIREEFPDYDLFKVKFD